MESPVRICLGAAIVVNLLLLSNAPVEGLALPNDITPTTVKVERPPRVKNNTAWAARNRSKVPDVALNELTAKEPEEEHTEKNAKYKGRGNRKFGDKKSTTTAPKRRATSSTEPVTLVIVTPTPEVKKPAQIIDSMRNYKKTKMPILSTTPIPASSSEESEESDSYEKSQDNSFTIPSFDDDHDFSHEFDNDSANNKVKKDSTYDFPSYSKEDSYGFKEDKEPFKSSFFDYDSELTTPKNEFFDKKHLEISSSITNKLDLIKAKSPPPHVTNIHKIVHQNIGLERLNNTPSNKSSVYFKNTKEIRLSDNEGAGTANKEFSDVHGTSVYYEMFVHATDTYTMDQSHEDDCDETLETTTAPTKDHTKIIKATQPTIEVSKPTVVDKTDKPDSQSTLESNFVPLSTIAPFASTSTPIAYSTQSYFSNERITKLFPNRNRNYSKRLNLTGSIDSPNNVTPKPEGTYTVRPQTRSKFRSTTPRTKPVWMAPKRSSTRVYIKTTSPRTIYEEHFSIKEQQSTVMPLQPSKTVLTTISSSEIDPVLQTDIIGTSKVVNSLFVTDNTIPSLSKRGSMRYKGTTSSSVEVDSNQAELEMSSAVRALASLISTPSLPGSVVNATENELQKVGEIIDKKQTSEGLTTTSTVSSISNDIITKKITDVEQNKLPWQPVYTPTASSDENNITVENKESLPAESIISLQSTAQPATTEAVKDNTLDAEIKSKEVKPLWIPATVETATTTDKNEISNITSNEPIQPIDASRSIGFESITKLPADVTTPQDESVASFQVNQTVAEKTNTSTDYEITTIRFSYGTTAAPTEQTEDITNTITFETTTSSKQSIVPTRTKITTIKEDTPITTYRPSYSFSTEIEETTTQVPDPTPMIEVSSQIIANTTESTLETTETTKLTEISTQPTVEITTETPLLTEPDAILTTTVKEATAFETSQTTDIPDDTTTTVIEVVTEINTEKSTIIAVSSSTETGTSSEETDSTSEENSHSNEIIYEIKTEDPSEKPPQETTTAKQKQRQSKTTQAPIISEEKTSEENKSDEKETTTTERQETTEDVSMPVTGVEDLNEVTTESASRGPEEAGAGAAIAIAVSTIGVIALVLLIGLLLVVRRRGRRGVYAQRCTPVSLDAYSLDSVSVGHRKGNTRLRASKRSYGNPAYDDEVTSHPMQYPALASFALDVESMCAEFAEIPNVSVRGEEVPAGCEDKNRYSNVLPLPETRVPLQRINNDPSTEYINANFVTGPGNIRNYYILAQAPLANTVVDFWRMIWEQNSRLVVMLTEYMENGVEKCYEYLPPSEVSDNKRIFGDFSIVLKKREQKDKYAVSTIQVFNKATRTWREVTHLWYFWPAKGLPEDYESVIDFLFEMRSYMKISQTAKEYDEEGVEVIYGDLNRSSFNNLSRLRDEHGSTNGVNVYSPAKAEEQMRKANNGTLSRMKAASEVEGIRPCVLTCASGAGRSAALAALDTCARALGAGRADVPRVVRAIRTMRPHALPNRHHYMWLYKVLSEYGNKIMGGADNI